MKKTIIVVLSLIIVFGVLAACSKGNTDKTTNNGTTTTTGSGDKTTATNVTVAAILSAIKAAYGESYLPNTEIPAELLESEFGLTKDMYKEVKAEQPMIGTHADRVIIVKAAEGKADAVETAFKTAKDKKISDTMQYPMNLAKINATQIVRNGDFVCFLLVGAVDENMDANEEQAKQFAETEVNKAVKAFNDLFK